ncbi:hypothetical protein ULF88_01985 [Halopseudomonas pachastrellae]|nr:hypothetical protein [Halopseudomonas pachastrellae]
MPCSLIADTAAASSMKYDPVSWVVVGAERIAANGDVITTQGTYALAILAMHHGLRFMVVASTATLDMSLSDGDALEPEVLQGAAGASQPLDVTPVELIDAIVTEKGVIERPDEGKTPPTNEYSSTALMLVFHHPRRARYVLPSAGSLWYPLAL